VGQPPGLNSGDTAASVMEIRSYAPSGTNRSLGELRGNPGSDLFYGENSALTEAQTTDRTTASAAVVTADKASGVPPLSPISESSSGVCNNLYTRSVSAAVSDESMTGSDSGVFETNAARLSGQQ